MVATKNSARHQWFFGTKIVLLFLFVVCVSVQVKAQTFQSTSPYSMTQQGRQAVDVNSAGSYHTYESTIYEPFSEAAPSSSNDRVPAGISGRRNGDINIDGEFGENSDGGYQENSYPIGEPWIMLAFAAMAAVVITLRKKQTA